MTILTTNKIIPSTKSIIPLKTYW